jgi:FtsH ternary system domain X3
MRVRVRFRYNADTGDVETFLVEDLGGTERAVDHDARHDRITADVARVIERDALIDEVLPGTAANPGEHRITPSEDPSQDSNREDHRVSE